MHQISKSAFYEKFNRSKSLPNPYPSFPVDISYFAFTNRHEAGSFSLEWWKTVENFMIDASTGTHPEGDSQRFLERGVLLSFHVCVVDQCGDGFFDATVVRGNPV